MHSSDIRDEVARRRAAGQSVRSVANQLGLSTRTVHEWSTGKRPAWKASSCWICGPSSPGPLVADHYAYLLGQYLGDGHLVTSTRVPVLRVYTCSDYPDIVEQVKVAVCAVRGAPPGSVMRKETDHMRVVQSYWKHWPCVLPQHGPGRKHERPIVLADWQQRIVDDHPWQLIRGLIHSDGCRAINRVTVRGTAYEYPRYFLANESRDILAIMGRTLDAVGVRWRYNRPNSISVARRESVALMEQHVGPKA